MGLKEQLSKIKDNWLLIALALVIFFVSMSGCNRLDTLSSLGGQFGNAYPETAMDKSALPSGYGGGYDYAPEALRQSENFAPEVEDRKIVKTAQVSSEVEQGKFFESESTLKNIITSSDAYLLNQNVNKYDSDRRSYYTGYYQIKVDVKKYDSVIAQLKEIGEVKYFNEDSADITGRYTDTKAEIETEKDRLKRYEAMYAESKDVKEKIDLTDRMFDLERQIKYLEDALENMDQRVDYSTVHVTLTEKRSDYAGIVFVKLSELVSSVVSSTNTLISIFVVLLPWTLAFLGIRLIVRKFRKRK